MRHLLGLLGIIAAGVLLAVSAAMNWRFGYSLGKTELDGQIYGAASAAADCFKALVPFFFFAAIKNRDVAALGASFNLCSRAWQRMLPAIFEHPTIDVSVMKRMRHYQRRYAGAMPSGCGVGYIYVASSEPVEGGFQVKVNLD